MDAAVGRHRAMLMVVGMLACGVVVGAVLLWPRGEVHRPAAAGQQDPTRLGQRNLDSCPAAGVRGGRPRRSQLHLELPRFCGHGG